MASEKLKIFGKENEEKCSNRNFSIGY